jgi:hypothetical protein
MPRDPERRRQEAEDHLDALAEHVRGVLDGTIPEETPPPGAVPANPNPVEADVTSAPLDQSTEEQP